VLDGIFLISFLSRVYFWLS